MNCLFLFRNAIITPKIDVNEPNKVIAKPVSLVISKKIPPILDIRIPMPIGYCGSIFNSFFITLKITMFD